MTHIGRVKWFDCTKGFGFLECKELGRDVFVGSKAVLLPPGEYLRAEQAVNFDIDQDRDGTREGSESAVSRGNHTADESRPGGRSDNTIAIRALWLQRSAECAATGR
jgi:CspA family cold shock protein